MQRAAVLLCLFGLLVDPPSSAAGQDPFVQITFLDVGQGDAVVIRAPDGETVLIDAGPASQLRYLQQMSVDELDLVIATHPHDDHIGGLVDVLTARPVHNYLDNGAVPVSPVYRQLMATLERLSEVTLLDSAPDTIQVGAISVEVLPFATGSGSPDGPSVATVVRFGAFSAFLSGDSERMQLDDLVAGDRVPDVTLLKAPHHGSVRGLTRSFLEAAHPEVVVISVGAGNPYGHPRPEALTAYETVARSVLRTDRDGPVSVVGYEDGSYEIVRGDEQELVGGGRFAPRTTVAASSASDREGAPVASSAGTDANGPGLSMEVVARAPGNDHSHLNAEHVAIINHRPSPVDIGRWRVCDLSSRCFRFPDDARIDGLGRVVVYTGYGMSDGVSFFMNDVHGVWNSNGDEASLYDDADTMIVRHVY